tara:strand:+ start:1497 stop:1907 length:411 start_codon:yes stop_codon:yes gene_type:complete
LSESFATTYAKAIDDISGKIFIPGLIASLIVEFGPLYQTWQSAGLIETYIFFVFIGFIASGLLFGLLAMISLFLFKGEDAAPFVAIVIMPLGFACLFPDYFTTFQVPLSQVTGVAILAWAFMLLNKGSFGHFEKDV